MYIVVQTTGADAVAVYRYVHEARYCDLKHNKLGRRSVSPICSSSRIIYRGINPF